MLGDKTVLRIEVWIRSRTQFSTRHILIAIVEAQQAVFTENQCKASGISRGGFDCIPLIQVYNAEIYKGDIGILVGKIAVYPLGKVIPEIVPGRGLVAGSNPDNLPEFGDSPQAEGESASPGLQEVVEISGLDREVASYPLSVRVVTRS